MLKKGNLYFTTPRLKLSTIRNVFKLGFPSFIMEFTIGIITIVYNIAIVKHGYGEIGLAAYLLIGYLMLIILTIFLGMAEGLQPVFSYFAGSGEVTRCNDIRRFATKVFLSIGIVCYLLIIPFSKYFYSIFNPEDMELIAFVTDKSMWYFFAFFFAGYNILMISFWQSTSHTTKALGVSLGRSVICLPILILILSHIFDKNIIWLCHSLSETITACLAFFMLTKTENNGLSIDRISN